MDFERLDNLTKERGVSKAHLCKLVNRDRSYIKDCKIKKINIPYETIKIWADALDSTPEYLTGKSDQKSKTPFDEMIKNDPKAKEFYENFLYLYKTDPTKFFEVADFIKYKVSQVIEKEDHE